MNTRIAVLMFSALALVACSDGGSGTDTSSSGSPDSSSSSEVSTSSAATSSSGSMSASNNGSSSSSANSASVMGSSGGSSSGDSNASHGASSSGVSSGGNPNMGTLAFTGDAPVSEVVVGNDRYVMSGTTLDLPAGMYSDVQFIPSPTANPPRMPLHRKQVRITAGQTTEVDGIFTVDGCGTWQDAGASQEQIRMIPQTDPVCEELGYQWIMDWPTAGPTNVSGFGIFQGGCDGSWAAFGGGFSPDGLKIQINVENPDSRSYADTEPATLTRMNRNGCTP